MVCGNGIKGVVGQPLPDCLPVNDLRDYYRDSGGNYQDAEAERG